MESQGAKQSALLLGCLPLLPRNSNPRTATVAFDVPMSEQVSFAPWTLFHPADPAAVAQASRSQVPSFESCPALSTLTRPSSASDSHRPF